MTQPATVRNQGDPGGRLFFFAIFVLLAILTLLVIRPFLSTIGLAVIFVVVLQPLYRFFLRREWISKRKGLALTLTLLFAMLVVLIPLYLFLRIAFIQGQLFFTDLVLPGGILTIEEFLDQIEERVREMLGGNFTLDTTSLANSLRSLARTSARWLGNLALNLGISLPALFARLTVFILLLILWLPRYTFDLDKLTARSPLPPEVTRLYMQKATAMLTGMFRGVFIISFAQGATMGVFLWIADVPFATFLTILSMFLAVLPVIGVFMVAYPVGIILLLTGQIWQGLLIIGGFLLVIANIDNVLRPMLVPKEAYLSPALVLLSVLGGLQLMGLLGAFYGPVIMILLATTFDVYAEYYAHDKHPERLTDSDTYLSSQAVAQNGGDDAADNVA